MQTDKQINRSTLLYSLICVILFISSTCLWLYLKPVKTVSILENNNKETFNLLAHWSRGNIVAIIRHAERCDRSDNKCLDEDNIKGITVQGRDESIKMGNNFRSLLSTDNAIIYNSPIIRTDQTAKFMFQGASITKKWLFTGCRENLLKDMMAHKINKKNLILITHSECIKSLGEEGGDKLINMKIDEKTYGIVIFVAIDEFTKQAYVLGYLFPNEWQKVINIYSQSAPNNYVNTDIE